MAHNSQRIELTRENHESVQDEHTCLLDLHFQQTEYSSIEERQNTEDDLRKKLTVFFRSPSEQWQAERIFPTELFVQIIKIIFVTLQLSLFANQNYIHVKYVLENKISFSHLFLQGWDAFREVAEYPPTIGPLSIYKQKEFYETIDYALNGYYNLNDSIGPYSYPNGHNGHVILCMDHFNGGIDKTCVNITKKEEKSSNILETLEYHQIKVNFSVLVGAELRFAVKTMNLKIGSPALKPDCYNFKITIIFDNKLFNGQMLLALHVKPVQLDCEGNTQNISENQNKIVKVTLLNFLVIANCLLSLVLCSRSIYHAQLLKIETMKLFKYKYGKDLSPEGKFEFLDLWFVMIIINDVLIIFGSIISEIIEQNEFGNNYWNTCSICLGTGNLLIWIGLLRFFCFSKNYKKIILTMKTAAPKIIKFFLFVIIIYAGFIFCGWLVLGPYNQKFSTLSMTAECLFALINGDEVFNTFSITPFDISPMLWWYSRLYFYIFIGLFTYILLTVLISVVEGSHKMTEQSIDELSKNDLQSFMLNEVHIPDEFN